MSGEVLESLQLIHERLMNLETLRLSYLRSQYLGVHDVVVDEETTPELPDTRFRDWYRSILSRPIPVPIETQPQTGVLKTDMSFRALRLMPYVDKAGTTFPLDHIKEIIPSANRYLKTCNKGRAFKTYEWTRVIGVGRPPPGLHVFDMPRESITGIQDQVLLEIQGLFQKQINNRDHRILMINPNSHPTNTILFYSRDERQPTFLEVMKLLKEHTSTLAEYIMIYCNIIMQILQIDEEQLEKCQISLVHYDPTAGLNPHIDSIHQFQDTIGPIATIAIGEGVLPKMFDLLPTLLDGDAVRILSYPNQITIMDGLSRIGWSHGLPWGYNKEQFTVAIKFPAIEREARIRYDVFDYNGVVTNVPSYV